MCLGQGGRAVLFLFCLFGIVGAERNQTGKAGTEQHQPTMASNTPVGFLRASAKTSAAASAPSDVHLLPVAAAYQAAARAALDVSAARKNPSSTSSAKPVEPVSSMKKVGRSSMNSSNTEKKAEVPAKAPVVVETKAKTAVGPSKSPVVVKAKVKSNMTAGKKENPFSKKALKEAGVITEKKGEEAEADPVVAVKAKKAITNGINATVVPKNPLSVNKEKKETVASAVAAKKPGVEVKESKGQNATTTSPKKVTMPIVVATSAESNSAEAKVQKVSDHFRSIRYTRTKMEHEERLARLGRHHTAATAAADATANNATTTSAKKNDQHVVATGKESSTTAVAPASFTRTKKEREERKGGATATRKGLRVRGLDGPEELSPEVQKELGPIAKIFEDTITELERVNSVGGDTARADWCDQIKEDYKAALEENEEPPKEASAMMSEVFSAHEFALTTANDQISFLCDDHVESNDRIDQVNEGFTTMVTAMQTWLDSMACQRGDRACIGGKINGTRPECSCLCDEGWEHGENEACEVCNTIEWSAGPWSRCSRAGKQTREVGCACAVWEPGVHFDESKCDAHPNRLASEQGCRYQPDQVSTQETPYAPFCMDLNTQNNNVRGEGCQQFALHQGWYWQGSEIRSEYNRNMCLTYDTSKKQHCRHERRSRWDPGGWCIAHFLWWCTDWMPGHHVYWNEWVCDDVEGDRNVYATGCGGGSNQKWYFDGTSKQIRSYADHKCLDYNYNNRNVFMHPCHQGWNQKWVVGTPPKAGR